MRIEILPAPKKGYNVLFVDTPFKEVSMVKAFSLALLEDMGYQLNPTQIEEHEGVLFFNISSSTERQVLAIDICRAIAKLKEG